MAASPREIAMAIDSLTPDELLRMRAFAVWRVRGLGRRSNGRDHNDLLQEAVARTVSGERRWNGDSVSFATHLLGAMRSISNHWATQGAEEEPVLFSELAHAAAAGHASNPVECVPSEAAGPEALVAVKQEIEALERLFADDGPAARVFDCVRRGLSGSAVLEATGYSRTQYETVMKRIRRRLRHGANRGATQ
jgi:hypothetical protein